MRTRNLQTSKTCELTWRPPTLIERLIVTPGDIGQRVEGFKHVDVYRADWLIVVASHSLVKCENIDARIARRGFLRKLDLFSVTLDVSATF